MSGTALLRFQRGLPQAKQAGERLRLLIVQGGDKGVAYCLLGDSILIGREDCQILIPDGNISKKHAEISWQGDHYGIRDLGSANGVIVNGKRTPNAVLNPGDLLVLGATVLQVCAAGQFKVQGRGASGAKDQESRAKESKLNEKRKLIFVGVIVFALYIAYSTSDTRETHRAHTFADVTEEEQKAQNAKKTKDQLLQDKQRMKTVFDEFSPKYSAKNPQSKDAEKFIHDGIREFQDKNYRRAIKDLETALTIDPGNDLAKLYLSRTKEQIFLEVQQDFKIAKEASSALRYNEARAQYENIMRLMEISRDDDSYKNDKYYIDAKDALDKLDKLQNEDK